MLRSDSKVVFDVIPIHWFLADIGDDIGFGPALRESWSVAWDSVLVPD